MENESILTDHDDASGAEAATTVADTDVPVEVVDELLIEEISIDGMCGVY